MLDKILLVILIVAIIVFIYFIANLIFRNFIKRKVSKRNETIFLLLLNLIKYSGLLVGIFIILYIFGVDTSSVLAGAGLLGILIGFGMQKLMQDFINGFFIIFENQYSVGDYVQINDIIGEVLEIGLKTTRLLSYEGECCYISNGEIKTVINYSKFPSLALIDLPISSENSYLEVERVIYHALKSYKNKNVIDPPRIIGIQQINEFYYEIRIICQTMPFEHFAIMRELRTIIIKALNSAHINMSNKYIYIRNKDSKQ